MYKVGLLRACTIGIWCTYTVRIRGTKELNWLFTNYKSKNRSKHVIEQYLDVAKLLPGALNTETIPVETKNMNLMDLIVTADEQQRLNSKWKRRLQKKIDH